MSDVRDLRKRRISHGHKHRLSLKMVAKYTSPAQTSMQASYLQGEPEKCHRILIANVRVELEMTMTMKIDASSNSRRLGEANGFRLGEEKAPRISKCISLLPARFIAASRNEGRQQRPRHSLSREV